MSGFDAASRSRERELMDADDVDLETFRGCLSDLARVNRLSLGYRPTLGFLERLRRGGFWPDHRPLVLVDVGFGFGDALREIAGWADRTGAAVTLMGLDRNPWAAEAAREATPAGVAIDYRTTDLFDFEPDGPIDVVISSLFTHHLGDEELIRFLTWMEATARIGWFVNDLRRDRLAYHGFAAAAGALRLHRFVRHDGPVSFARAFVEDDWRRALAAAGLAEGAAEIARRAPYRLCVARVKPARPTP